MAEKGEADRRQRETVARLENAKELGRSDFKRAKEMAKQMARDER